MSWEDASLSSVGLLLFFFLSLCVDALTDGPHCGRDSGHNNIGEAGTT